MTISLDALVGTSDELATIQTAGPIPAQTARDLVVESTRSGAPV